MSLKSIKTTQELQKIIDGTQSLAFEVPAKKSSRYAFIQSILKQFDYSNLDKLQKGIVIRFLLKLSDYSRQQLTRLIRQYLESGNIQIKNPNIYNGFKKKYSIKDINLLAEMDDRYNTPSGAFIKKQCERASTIFNQKVYSNLSKISVSHLYNLRRSMEYVKKRRFYTKTKSCKNSIGSRRKPRPNGKPGFIRIDTVHQGDLDGKKGVYHINAIDEVTQFEIVLSVSRISKKFLIPILKTIIKLFPFKIESFHADNGSEYINYEVAKLLNMINVELTKSRSRHSNDNALAESKNASVVRRIYGYKHIPPDFADELNKFNMDYLIPYINYHRPCYFPSVVIDNKGKERKKYYYKDMMTPYEKFKSLNNADLYLKDGFTFEIMEKEVYKMSDNEAVDKMNIAKEKLFKRIYEQKLA